MKNSNIEKQHDINFIESNKSKFFFIGFITALIPYIILIILFNKIHYYNLYKYTFILIALLTAIVNGVILSYKATKKLNNLFNSKYDK